jgi:Ca2+-binding RTX toxin-like protein
LSEGDFPNLGSIGVLTTAHFHVGNPVNGNAQIDYTSGNGFLYYDPDGNGPDARVHFATLTTHPALIHADFIVEA